MNVRNLTGVPVVLVDEKGNETHRYEPGHAPPPKPRFHPPQPVEGLPFPAAAFSDAPYLMWMPPPLEGTLYIVTAEAANYLHGRSDCYVPGLAFRDEHGRVKGHKRLNRVAPRPGYRAEVA